MPEAPCEGDFLVDEQGDDAAMPHSLPKAPCEGAASPEATQTNQNRKST